MFTAKHINKFSHTVSCLFENGNSKIDKNYARKKFDQVIYVT